MEKLNILAIKLKKLVDGYESLKEDNYRLKAEIDFLKKEVKEHKNRLSENIMLKEKQKKAILRLEQILKKISLVRA